MKRSFMSVNNVARDVAAMWFRRQQQSGGASADREDPGSRCGAQRSARNATCGHVDFL
jgi:hypothetical protein